MASKKKKTISVGGKNKVVQVGSKADKKYSSMPGATSSTKSSDVRAASDAIKARSSAALRNPSLSDTPRGSSGTIQREITSSVLEPASGINLPDPPSPGRLGTDALTKLTALSGDAQMKANEKALDTLSKDPLEEAGDTFFNNYLKTLQADKPQSSEAIYEDVEKRAGLRAKQQQVNNLTAQLNAITTKAQADKLGLIGQGRGVTEAIIGGQQAQLDREAAIASLPIAAQLSAAQDDLEAAQDYVQTMFQIRVEDARAQREYRRDIAKSVYDYADKKQQRALDRKEKEEDRNFDLKLKDIDFAQSLAVTAIQNGQPSLAARIMALDPSSPTYKSSLASIAGGIRVPQKGAGGGEGADDTLRQTVAEAAGEVVDAASYQRVRSRLLVLLGGKYSSDLITSMLDQAVSSGEAPAPVDSSPTPAASASFNYRPLGDAVASGASSVINRIGSFLFGR